MNERNPLSQTQFYRTTLLEDVIPFWLRNGLDAKHGGYLTALDRDGSVIDTDKSVWFQGRGAWVFATLYNTVEKRAEWLEAARLGVEFLRQHCFSPSGKMYFTVTREGRPLRMRRYVYSEAFAAIALAAWARATGEARAADEACRCFATYLDYRRQRMKVAEPRDACRERFAAQHSLPPEGVFRACTAP